MNKTMLVVDDSEPDRYIIKKLTERSGLFDHVYTLNDGEEAYNHFRNIVDSKQEKGGYFPPAVIVLDINMPCMNGFEFLESFEKLSNRNEYNSLFVAMLSSSESEDDKKRAMSHPLVELFITKPFRKEHIKILSQKVTEKAMNTNG